VRGSAAYALGKLGDKRAVKPLQKRLECETQKKVKVLIYYALGKLGDKRVIEPLIVALKDTDWQVRWQVRLHAAYALDKLDDKRAIGPLKKALAAENPVLREPIQSAIEKLESPPDEGNE